VVDVEIDAGLEASALSPMSGYMYIGDRFGDRTFLNKGGKTIA
jgi:hypothetical protein